MRKSLIIFILLLASMAMHGQTDIFQGAYVSNETGISLWLKKEASGYSGQFLFRENVYTVTGLRVGNLLYGEYLFNDHKIAFLIKKAGEKYTLTSEGVDIALQLKSRTETTLPAGTSAQHLPDQGPVIPPLSNTPVIPAKGKLLKDPAGTFECSLPANWTADRSESNFKLSDGRSGPEIILTIHNEQSIDASMAQLQDINDPESQTYLQNKVQKLNAGTLYIISKGRSGQQPVLMEILSLFSPYGGGYSVIINFGTILYDSMYIRQIRSLAASTRFSKPVITAAVQQWQQRLSGKKLLYLHTDSYSSQRTDINLFANGQFDYNDNNGMLSSGGAGTGSYAGESRFAGTWKIQQTGTEVLLILLRSNGQSLQFTLQPIQGSSAVLLNNKKYFTQSL